MKNLSPGSSRSSKQAFTLIEVMIVVGIIGIIIAIAAPTWIRQRNLSQQRSCQENMSKIDGAKSQWCLENRQNGSASVAMGALFSSSGNSYLNYRPECPTGGSYTLGTVAQATTCSTIDPVDHNDWR